MSLVACCHLLIVLCLTAGLCLSMCQVFTRRHSLAAHPCPGPRRAAQGWPCPHCSRLFTTAAAGRRHQRRHTGALRCPGCGRHFASAATRSAHVCRAAASADRPHACPQCSRRFASAASLRQHAALHSDRFACPRCARRFSGAAPLRRHAALCGAGEQLARTGCVACRRCQAQFDSLPALAEHARHHELPHRCATCSRRFRSRLQLGAHVCSRLEPDRPAVRGSRPARPAAPATVVCETCAQTFPSKKSLWLHRFTHAERQFACELCGCKFKRKDTMLAHLATHSQPMVGRGPWRRLGAGRGVSQLGPSRFGGRGRLVSLRATLEPWTATLCRLLMIARLMNGIMNF